MPEALPKGSGSTDRGRSNRWYTNSVETEYDLGPTMLSPSSSHAICLSRML
jgi:hypothetical protein